MTKPKNYEPTYHNPAHTELYDRAKKLLEPLMREAVKEGHRAAYVGGIFESAAHTVAIEAELRRSGRL